MDDYGRAEAFSALVLAVVLVMTVAVIPAHPASGAAGEVSANRTIGQTDVQAGVTTTVTLDIHVDSDRSRIAITEEFDPPFTSVDALDVEYENGSGTTFTTSSSSDIVSVTATDVTAGTTMIVTYDVTVVDSPGTTHTMDGSVTSGAQTIAPSGDSQISVGSALSITLNDQTTAGQTVDIANYNLGDEGTNVAVWTVTDGATDELLGSVTPSASSGAQSIEFDREITTDQTLLAAVHDGTPGTDNVLASDTATVTVDSSSGTSGGEDTTGDGDDPPRFVVSIDTQLSGGQTISGTNSPVTAGDSLNVTATVTNTGDEQGTQTVTLSVNGTQRDATSVTLAGGETNTTVPLYWQTSGGDAGNYTVTVASEASTDSTTVRVERLRTEDAYADIDKERMTWDAENDRVVVPAAPNVTIFGITNVAAGTNLTVQVNSKAGQGEGNAFFDLQTNIYPRFVEDRDVQVWAVTNEDDFANADPGVEFEIKIRREGAAGNLNPPPAIDGVVAASPRVQTFEFGDQESGGDTVIVDTLQTSRGGFIVLTDHDGAELGRSTHLVAENIHENIAISLNDSLDDGNHSVTATVYRSAGEPYPDPSKETAMVSVGGEGTELPANFQVDDISPESAEVELPDDRFNVSASITNTGDVEATQEVVFRFDGTKQDSERITLAGGESTTVTFRADIASLERNSSAVYSIASNDGSQSGTVSATAANSRQGENATSGGDGNATETAGDERDDGNGASGPGFGVGMAILAVILTVGFARLRTGGDA